MSLNDQRDKLDVAEQYLINYPANSQEFEAALEHLRWVYLHDNDSIPYVAQIYKRVRQHAVNAREDAKVRSLNA